MASFQITGPDGKKYRVQGENPSGAMAALKKMLAQSSGLTGHNNVPEYVPPGVEGYDPATGEVTAQVGALNSAATGAADAATFGFGDELASYPASWLSGVPREQVLSEMRGQMQQAQEQNPKSYLAGQLGGGVAMGLISGPATASARFSGSALLPRMAAGAADGLVAGGLYGAGSGTDAESRARGAAVSGALGGVMGGAFPLVSAGVSKAYETARNAISSRPIAQQAGASPEALRVLGGVLDADGSLGPQGQANMARAGQEAMLADAGPTARRALDTAIQRSGPGAVVAREAIDARVGRDAAALTGALDDVFGSPQGVGSAQRAIGEAARPQVSAAYQRAYSSPIDYSSSAGRQVEDIFKRMPSSMTRRAVQQANELMQWEGLPSQIMASVSDDGAVAFREMPNVVQADYVKKALDRIVQDGTDDITGKLSSDALLASRVARDLRTALGDAVPAYREALETAADPLSRQAAIRVGSKLLSPSMTRDQVATAVSGMSGPERQALAQGVRSQLDDAMARVTRTVADGDTGAREAIKALKDLSSRANRDKLSLALGDDAANRLFAEVDRVAQSFDLKASVADNSATYARQAMERRVSDTTAPGMVGTAARGEPVNATKRIIQALTGQTDDALRGREDAIYGEVARLLTQQGGAGQNVYNAINQIGQTDAATALMRDRIARALAGPQLSYPAAILSGEGLPR